jgi:deoxyhypusine synthase
MRGTSGLERVRDIHLRPSRDIVNLVEQMGRSGGFMAKELARTASIVDAMTKDRDCTKFLSFPAAPVATGMRGVLVDMVRAGMVDAIVTASGTLDHDLARSYSGYYHGSFMMDDESLYRQGFHRLGNVVIPLRNYGPLIEKKVQPLLESLYAKGVRKVTTEELCGLLGESIASKESILHWASKKGVPVFVPGIMDGAVGSQIWLFAERHRDFQVDVIGDERRLSDIVLSAKRSGAVVIGGGISKHHVLWWNQFKEGLDYACYITTAVEYDGSLSGAQVREAISWGKVKGRARKATLYADVTTVLPLIVSYVLAKRRGTSG